MCWTVPLCPYPYPINLVWCASGYVVGVLIHHGGLPHVLPLAVQLTFLG